MGKTFKNTLDFVDSEFYLCVTILELVHFILKFLYTDEELFDECGKREK